MRRGEASSPVAKSIINSPLVKTAIHGADPNWGRIAMAVGKVNDDDIVQNKVVIRIGSEELFRSRCPLKNSRHTYKATRCSFMCHSNWLGNGGRGAGTTDGYVRINADYTT